ncbi:UDP-glycosyltransferase 85A5-like [Pyrus ussuriensis x Pyrus communis]|uniref:UDP-glycosyltransferase 85A5-like n=1 Tax=Pyrus ussuriensis x Pyrus communis TaxID=2448454 RepID=A0A5N5GDP2_9ROSA|nr:UDP-glycosyltransferase 85A5-like [Pyrus ussuriensis x Pyrus communis]
MDATAVVTKPHAVCIPIPVQSHIKAMLKFAKLLHSRGFHITFVNTEFNHKRFLKSLGPDSLDDGLPDSDEDATQDLILLADSIRKQYFLAPFRGLLNKLNNDAISTSNNPPVTCIVSDGFLSPFTITAAQEVGIPSVLLYTFAACAFMGFMQFRTLVQKGLAPLKDSVMYVNFGSVAVMNKLPFFWVIRPDLVVGESAILQPEFVAETKERSLIASWCPQEQVLNHPSVGGFLTHSGWNSTIESLTAGVPMLCWPYFSDQQMNCHYTCNEWGIGMEIKKLVKELMGGEKGKKLKNKVMEWKKLAKEATGPNGSSYKNLDNLVNQVLLRKT